MKNHPLNNKVIKNLNKSHGQQIKSFFAKHNVDEYEYKSYDSTEKNNGVHLYYGIINGEFNNYSKHELNSNVEIITIDYNSNKEWKW